MTSEPAITFYDITSTLTPKAWSPNTWKARLVLNYKRIPYKTVWVSYPDIEATVKKLGGPPTTTKVDDPSTPHYTLPAIVDVSNGAPVVVTDSLAIAEYLDATYPDRPVFPKEGKALQYAFEECFQSIVRPHFAMIMLPRIWSVLDDRGKVYFRETRERWFKKRLEEFSPEGTVRDGQWEALKQGFDKLAAILDKNGPGVAYVAGGSKPTRADMVIISYIAWVKIVAPQELSKRLEHWNGGRWERLWNKSEEWRAVH